MKIRKIEKKDLDQIVELYDKFLKYLGKFGRFVKDKDSKRDDKEKIRSALRKRIDTKKNNIFLVAEENKNLLGFIEARVLPHKESKTQKKVIEIVDIYVAKKRKGIGKKLFNEIEKWSISQNANFISWEFLYGNKVAENFCIKNKFKHFRVEMLKKLR